MERERRVRITEKQQIEGGVPCPECGRYTSFGDIVATGSCAGANRADDPCEAELALDLVVR